MFVFGTLTFFFFWEFLFVCNDILIIWADEDIPLNPIQEGSDFKV